MEEKEDDSVEKVKKIASQVGQQRIVDIRGAKEEPNKKIQELEGQTEMVVNKAEGAVNGARDSFAAALQGSVKRRKMEFKNEMKEHNNE